MIVRVWLNPPALDGMTTVPYIDFSLGETTSISDLWGILRLQGAIVHPSCIVPVQCVRVIVALQEGAADLTNVVPFNGRPA